MGKMIGLQGIDDAPGTEGRSTGLAQGPVGDGVVSKLGQLKVHSGDWIERHGSA